MNESKVLQGLNAEQRSAASIINGPVCTNAGPGSGKTRTLTHSIAYRIEQGADPRSIVAITFTNKAKNEIKDRLGLLLNPQAAKQVFVGTYHGFLSVNVLMPNKKHPLIKSLGYKDGFVIAEADDSDKILDEAIKAMPALSKVLFDLAELSSRDVKAYMASKRSSGYFATGFVKNFSETRQDVLAAYLTIKKNLHILASSPDSEFDKSAVLACLNKNPEILDLCKMSAWRSYENRMIKLNALDFDGMMVVSKYLLENDPELTQRIALDAQHILLDEFQDTNDVQWDCMKLIIDKLEKKNVLVVGDPDQCIYQFRNANPQIMRDFDQIFPDAAMKYLTVNYRSTSENVALCNAIKGFINPSNLDHPMSAFNKTGDLPTYQFFQDEKEEANYVFSEIKQKLMSGVKPDNIAVLYRGKSQRRVVEQMLSENQMPYYVVGDVSFYETKEVKDAISMLRMISNELDILGFARGLSASNIAVKGLTMRQEIEKAKDEGKEVTPMKYLFERFTPKKITPAAKIKMDFWLLLRELIDLDKGLSEEEYIFRWVVDGFRESGSPLAEAMTKEQALGLYADAKSKDMLHPLFEQDMKEARASFHSQIVSRLRTFFDQYYLEKLVSYSESTDKKNGEHSAEKLQDRLDNIDQVFRTVETKLNESGDFEQCVNELVLLTEQDVQNVSDCIQLMTIHASKGLEFDSVFLIGTEQRSYFSQSTLADNFESEACAFFVATSRAENNNFITGARGRTINGSYDKCGELEFVKKLPNGLMHDITQRNVQRDDDDMNQDPGNDYYMSDINEYTPPPKSKALPIKNGQIDFKSMMRP